jgi:hypothetical protein
VGGSEECVIDKMDELKFSFMFMAGWVTFWDEKWIADAW